MTMTMFVYPPELSKFAARGDPPGQDVGVIAYFRMLA